MALFFSGLPVSAQGGGSISGEVKFAGAAPAPKVVKVNKDNEVCGQEKKIVDVAVGAGGGLGETLVSVAAPRAPSPSGSRRSSTRRGASSTRTCSSWRRVR